MFLCPVRPSAPFFGGALTPWGIGVPDAAWKAFERAVAAIFGGERRGPDTRGVESGKTDVIHSHFAIECKLLGAPGWSQILAATKQAEVNAEPGQEPIAVVKRKNARMADTLVVMRLERFREWRLSDPPGGEPES